MEDKLAKHGKLHSDSKSHRGAKSIMKHNTRRVNNSELKLVHKQDFFTPVLAPLVHRAL